MEKTTNDNQKEKSLGSKMLHSFYSTYKNIKLYKSDHPTSQENARKFSNLLNTEVFREKLGLSLTNADGIFSIGDIFFIEESLTFYDLLRSLEERHILALVFNQGVTEYEIIELCQYLLQKKSPGISDSGFAKDHVKTVSESKATIASQRSRNSKYQGSDSYILMREFYDEWLLLSQQIFSKLLDEQSISMSDLIEPMDRLIDYLHRDPSVLSSVVATVPITQLHYQHSLHTMIYTLYLGLQLNLDSDNIRTLGLSALVHDIGRFFLPSDFTSHYKLQKGDADFIHLHSRDGASYLSGVQGLPMSVIRSVLEHHLGYDGKGYPQISGLSSTHTSSQLVALADFASWSTLSEEYYHKPVKAHRLVRTLIARAGTQFDPLYVKLFIPFLGLFPAGTHVRLSTGEKAVVLQPNPTHLTRPKVALQQSTGNFIPFDLTQLSELPHGSPYKCSIQSILGSVPQFEPFHELINFSSPEPR